MDPHDEREDSAHEGATEQVEDYLRLEKHIEQLQADRRPPRPPRLSPDQMRVYQTAALFSAGAPGSAEPDPAFVERLRARVERELPRGRSGRRGGRARSVSRRTLLAGGLTAAAAAAAGVVAGVGLERAETSGGTQGTQGSPTTSLVPNGAWVALFATDTLPIGGVRRFVTEQVVGFVRHTASGFEAFSGACTHMGCLVAWNPGSRTFDCPCHGGRFLENGKPAPSSPVVYRPLPAIQARVENNQVQVFLPVAGAGAGTTGGSGAQWDP